MSLTCRALRGIGVTSASYTQTRSWATRKEAVSKGTENGRKQSNLKAALSVGVKSLHGLQNRDREAVFQENRGTERV